MARESWIGETQGGLLLSISASVRRVYRCGGDRGAGRLRLAAVALMGWMVGGGECWCCARVGSWMAGLGGVAWRRSSSEVSVDRFGAVPSWAREVVELAWRHLPAHDRQLLESIGVSQWRGGQRTARRWPVSFFGRLERGVGRPPSRETWIERWACGSGAAHADSSPTSPKQHHRRIASIMMRCSISESLTGLAWVWMT